jgi:hypothetical protein
MEVGRRGSEEGGRERVGVEGAVETGRGRRR